MNSKTFSSLDSSEFQPLVWHDLTNVTFYSWMEPEKCMLEQIIQDKYKPDLVELNFKWGNLAFASTYYYPSSPHEPTRPPEYKAILSQPPYTIVDLPNQDLLKQYITEIQKVPNPEDPYLRFETALLLALGSDDFIRSGVEFMPTWNIVGTDLQIVFYRQKVQRNMPDVFTKCTLTIKHDGSHELQCEPLKEPLSEDEIKQLLDPSAIQPPLVWRDITNDSYLSDMDTDGRIIKQLISEKYKPDFVGLDYKLGNLAFVHIGQYNPPNIMDVPRIKSSENKAILTEPPYTIVDLPNHDLFKQFMAEVRKSPDALDISQRLRIILSLITRNDDINYGPKPPTWNVIGNNIVIVYYCQQSRGSCRPVLVKHTLTIHEDDSIDHEYESPDWASQQFRYDSAPRVTQQKPNK